MSQHDTAGIIADGEADADWKKTLEIANRRFAENQAALASTREESESGKTVPEWWGYLPREEIRPVRKKNS